MSKHFFCPICGQTQPSYANICSNCKNYITPKESMKDSEYYREKSMHIYGNYHHTRELFLKEEVEILPTYNPNTNIHNAELEYNREHNRIKQIISNTQNNQFIPKCPICQSPNIQKLGTGKRVAHGFAFGLFSKTARSQWECKNCGNKW